MTFLGVLHNGLFYASIATILLLIGWVVAPEDGSALTVVKTLFLLSVATVTIFTLTGLLMRLIYLIRGLVYFVIDTFFKRRA